VSADPLTPTLHEYQLRLPSFEGPLDVLLSLIERERLDISDLSLVSVTDGFIAYIDQLDNPSAGLLAEFAGIASRLIVLKSRSMLPRPETVEAEPDPEDLAEQLREYQRMKQAASQFREQEGSGLRTFARPPTVISTPPKVVLVAPPVTHLRRALVRTLARVRQEPEVAALRRVVTIGEMRNRLRDTLSRFNRRWRFRELIGTSDRETTIVGFIALLAMLRRGEIDAEQDGLFNDIHVTPVAGAIMSPADD
jgi:segregation and condensation protein A